jgi:hypothetical protein
VDEWLDIIWIDGPGGNVEHIAENDVTPAEVEQAFENAIEEGRSDSSGRPLIFGLTRAGRRLVVVYERIDEITVYPITAYEVET